MPNTRKVRSAESKNKVKNLSRRRTSKYRIGMRLFNFKSGKTGAVVNNVNDEHVMMKLNYPGHIVKVKKSESEPVGRPCKKKCATCGCIPHETSGKDMPFNSIPGQPPSLITPVPENSNADDKYFNTARNLMKQKYLENHSVNQRNYKIKPIHYPLYTTALTTCSALMMDIHNESGNLHFLTHIDGSETPKQINEMISSISKECTSKISSDCIHNIKVWGGAGSEKEEGLYLNDPNKISMMVIIKVLEGLDLVDVKDGVLYYKGTDREIPVVKTCFRHYIGNANY